MTRMERYYEQGPEASSQAGGFILFASLVMFLSGTFHVITGASAVYEESFFVIAPNYALDMSIETWGWLQVAGGLLIILTAFAIFGGAKLARTVAIVLASLSAVANFISIPYYPAWSLVMIALDALIIMSVTAYGHYVDSTPDEL